MTSTIILNENNIFPDGFNNKLVYNFPNSLSFPNHEICIQNIKMYYSWENVNDTNLNNNIFYLYFPNSVGGYTANKIVIPNGMYELRDLNAYLQWYCMQQGYYLIRPNGLNVYFAEFILNTSTFTVQLNTYAVSSIAFAEGNGWTVPVGYPDTTGTIFPIISMYDTTTGSFNNFYKLIGFPSNFNSTTGMTQLNSTKSYLSTVSPVIQPNENLLIGISNIENKYTNPTTLIGTITSDVEFGQLIDYTPPNFAWVNMLIGTYNGIRILLTGSTGDFVKILDPVITITLAIRNKKDDFLMDELKLIK